MVESNKNNSRVVILQTLILLGILVLINVISRSLYTFVDLTEDKRFTLTDSTQKLLEEVDDIIYIDVLLSGDLPSGFKRLQDRTEEVIKQMRSINPNIEYKFSEISKGTPEEINNIRLNLAKDNIYPFNLLVMEEDQRVEKLIYPFALLQLGSRKIPIRLLDAMSKGEGQEQTLNKSANSLEYKFASAIEKLFKKDAPIVLFTEGNGELLESQTATLEQGLRNTMTTGRINLDSIYRIDESVDVLIVARPTEPLKDKHKFIIDQYIMNGGKVIWFIEPLFANLDSINMKDVYVPRLYEHGLDDMFFKYGVRLKNDLVLSLENSNIPQVIGRGGGQAQQELFHWVYHPLLQSSGKHPIVNNIDRVYSTFPSSIDLLERPDLEQTVLLTSSKYSRYQLYPMRLSFEIIKIEQNPEAYNKPYLPVAVMVEGEFESFYKNRVTKEMEDGLASLKTSFVDKSSNTSQVFVADSDIIKNLYNPRTEQISPLGFNKWDGMEYKGNSEFLANLVDYMTDEYGLIEARTKNLQLRLLDQVKIKQEKTKWQLINILLPIVLVLLFGLLFNYFRKKKYGA